MDVSYISNNNKNWCSAHYALYFTKNMIASTTERKKIKSDCPLCKAQESKLLFSHAGTEEVWSLFLDALSSCTELQIDLMFKYIRRLCIQMTPVTRYVYRTHGLPEVIKSRPPAYESDYFFLYKEFTRLTRQKIRTIVPTVRSWCSSKPHNGLHNLARKYSPNFVEPYPRCIPLFSHKTFFKNIPISLVDISLKLAKRSLTEYRVLSKFSITPSSQDMYLKEMNSNNFLTQIKKIFEPRNKIKALQIRIQLGVGFCLSTCSDFLLTLSSLFVDSTSYTLFISASYDLDSDSRLLQSISRFIRNKLSKLRKLRIIIGIGIDFHDQKEVCMWSIN
jgi:hypothetical protein